MTDVLTLYRSFAAREIRPPRLHASRDGARHRRRGRARSAPWRQRPARPRCSSRRSRRRACAARPRRVELLLARRQRAKLASGTVVNGEQMYVEYFVPAQVRHPFSIVLVHGGGGQGLDWMTTPDGRPGWVHHLVQEGYRVYVVDRPGHGRSPFHPDAARPVPASAPPPTRLWSGSSPRPRKRRRPTARRPSCTTSGQGTGVLGDPTVDQVDRRPGRSFPADLGAHARGLGASAPASCSTRSARPSS